MPFAPELFSAPVLQRVLDRRRLERLRSMPFVDGMMSGEVDALVGSFAGVPEVHHPVRGRIKGEPAFRRYVADMSAWLEERHVEVEDVGTIRAPGRGVEEVVLHLDHEGGRIRMPVALASEHDDDDRIRELRLYFSARPLGGRHLARPPLLQADPELREPDVVGAYRRAAGPTPPCEPCAVTDDGRLCAVEYNVVDPELPPQAGLAVYVRGERVAARVYDDAQPPSRTLEGAVP